jgi:hypothetical protein
MVPFSGDTRVEMKERSEGKSELSGIEGEEMVCAHLNHNKGLADYDSIENGLRVTKHEECAYHMMHLHCPEKIGMQNMQNRSVVVSYITQFLKKEDYETTREKIGEAIDWWEKREKAKKYVFKDDSYLPPLEKKKERYQGYIPPAL